MTQAQSPAAEVEHGHGRGLRTPRKPRYLQIAETLRSEIRHGDHPVGRHLPTEVALCKRFSISRFTARGALRLLEEQGLISRRRGSGTTVRSAEVRNDFEQHVHGFDDLLQFTNATQLQLLYSDRVAADSTMAGWLNVRVGSECLHFHGIRYHRRTQAPYCLGDIYRRASWQGLAQGQGFTRLEDAMRHFIEAQNLQRIGRVEQSLSAVALTEDQAHELKVRDDTPGFRAVRRYFDLKGHLMLVAVTLHPGHLFSYFTRFERSEQSMRI
jgi:GntR family transcriptional regulator